MRFSSNRVDDAGLGDRGERRPREENPPRRTPRLAKNVPQTPKHYVFKPLAVDHRPERPNSDCGISVTIAPTGAKINRINRFFSLFFRERPDGGGGRGENERKMRRSQSRANHSVSMAATMGAVVEPPDSPSSTTAAKLRSSPVFGWVTKPLNQVFLPVSVVSPTSAVPVFA